ncbi:hypothetical protein [Xenorhabdus koppenhoeferi]|uniref:Uncharacterized protein n=1 Tax=Xenorhabdus koppenhoeferi TaxID=351659 RepID=A0A1I7EXG1_9GAMM|nr:hypothetical protein [Xenorhabdus koppenhoeferi]SFU28612.1 hypothetical protein SAMN05421784_10257 [Xenorhabdus koppenhoeferi]
MKVEIQISILYAATEKLMSYYLILSDPVSQFLHIVCIKKHQLVDGSVVQELLSVCSYIKIEEKIISLTEESRNNVVQLVSRYNGQGFRVLILVTRELSTDGANYPLFITDEKAMMQ